MTRCLASDVLLGLASANVAVQSEAEFRLRFQVIGKPERLHAPMVVTAKQATALRTLSMQRIQILP